MQAVGARKVQKIKKNAKNKLKNCENTRKHFIQLSQSENECQS